MAKSKKVSLVQLCTITDVKKTCQACGIFHVLQCQDHASPVVTQEMLTLLIYLEPLQLALQLYHVPSPEIT